MDANIVKQLKMLKDVKPSASWLISQRSFLLSEISRETELELVKTEDKEKTPAFSLPSVFSLFKIFKLPKTVFSLAMILVVLASSLGTLGIISAAQNSLPGDALYVLKSVVENAQMTFAQSEENRAVLSIKFATQRVDEFAQIAQKPEKKANIEQAAKDLASQLVAVQDNMDKLKSKNSEKAVEMAKLVNDQTNAYKETLIRTSDKLAYLMPEEREKLKTEIDQVLVEISKTQEKADNIIGEIKEIENK